MKGKVSNSDVCPADDALLNLLSGELDPTGEALIETHVMQCPGCEEKLARLSDSEQLQQWKALLSDEAEESQFTDRKIHDAVGLVVDYRDASSLSDFSTALESAGFCEIEQIGSGGMGVVYKARQSSLDRTVAVKVLRSNPHREDHRRRFVREAESIAKINHENVLKIHDVGETSGLPHLVLEYINGPSLATFLNRQPQSPKTSAVVVRQIANGVAAAHEKEIVHRDIKPANILLMPDEPFDSTRISTQLESYIPKVADFGLAKEAQASDETQTRFTQTNQLVGTPTYMSPEQIAGKRESVGVASDVYSIGVLLYEMLTGYPPFTGKTPYQLLKKIETLDPISPRRQNKSIPKDLEAICFKCLEKDPAQRYENANWVAEDFSSFLNGKPVVAKPPNWFGTSLKWIRRNPAAASLAATITLGLIAGLAVWATVTSEMASLNSKLQVRNKRLVEQQKISEDVNNFLQNDLLRQASTSSQMDWLIASGEGPESYKRDPSLKSILDRAADKIKSEESAFEDEPRVRASLLNTIADTYRSLGDYDEAIEFYQMALESIPDSETAEIADMKRRLALALAALEQYSKAHDLLVESQDMYRNLGEDFETEVLELDVNLADVSMSMFEDEDTGLALEHAQRAYDGLVSKFGELHRSSLAAASTLAKAKLETGETSEAIELLGLVSIETSAQLGAAHPHSLAAKYRLAEAKQETLQPFEALELKTEVWQLAKESLGESHPETLYYQIFAAEKVSVLDAGSMSKADLDRRLAEAAEMLENTQEEIRKTYRPQHRIHDQVVWILAEIYRKLERHEELIELCINRSEVLAEKENARVVDIARLELIWAKSLVSSGDFDKAIPKFKACITKLTESYGDNNEWTGVANKELGMAYLRSGKTELAASALEEAYKLQCISLGPDSSVTLETGIGFYMCVNELQDYPRCEVIARSILENFNVHTPQDGFIALTIRQGLAIALAKQDKLEEAEKIVSEVVKQYVKNYPNEHAGYQFMTLQGSIYLKLKRLDEAEETLIAAWDGLERTADTFKTEELRKFRMSDLVVNLCKLYKETGDEEALKKWTSKLKELQ